MNAARRMAGYPPARMRRLLPFILVALTGACSNIEEAKPRPKPSGMTAQPAFEIEVDPILRGTIASEAILVGFEDAVVRGYGVVVGLKGTGSRMMPAEVRAFLLQELARNEISDTVKGMGVSPERFLDSDDIAAVVVEGIIPAGSPRDTRFDVRVFAVPGSGTTSLEGGRLWTADLRAGPLTAGSRQAAIFAEAKGPILINPFAPSSVSSLGDVDRLSGRVLNGGRVLKDMMLRLRLATPSHTRAGAIVSAINSRFAREPGQRDDTARETLRMVLSAISNAEVAGDEAVVLSDDQVTAVLRGEAKKRAEAAQIYADAGRGESADKERAELAVIERYLPAAMSDDALAAVVAEEVAKAAASGASGGKAMGQVVKAVRERVGASVDGGAIAAKVKAALG